MIWRRNEIPFTASSAVILISLPKIYEQYLSSLNVPWINNDIVTSRTKVKKMYSLNNQSKIQEHSDECKAFKKEL
jgi:hypothetical protein